MSIGKRLKELRKELKLSSKIFAENIGEKDYKIRDSETEKQKIANDLLEKIGIYYNINLNWLLTGKGEMFLSNYNGINIKNKNGNVAINGNINVNTKDYADSEEIKEVIELLKYASKPLLDKFADKLKKIKSDIEEF
jgi:transcriptional regulator with XRE-family HTH domain